MDKEMLEAIAAQISRLELYMKEGFAQLNDRVDKVDGRLDGVETRMEQMDSRMNHMTASMKLMESRMEKMEGRMGRMEDDIAILREDCDITRAAANELIDWTGEINQAVGFPLPKLGEKIS